MSYVLRFWEMAGPGPSPAEREDYLKSYVDTPCGRGKAEFTKQVQQALKFKEAGEALRFWRQQSKTVPLRGDGKPNRPLTAYTMIVEPA